MHRLTDFLVVMIYLFGFGTFVRLSNLIFQTDSEKKIIRQIHITAFSAFLFSLYLFEAKPLIALVVAAFPSFTLLFYNKLQKHLFLEKKTLFQLRFVRNVRLKIFAGGSLLEAIELEENKWQKSLHRHVTFTQHLRSDKGFRPADNLFEFISPIIELPVNAVEKLKLYEEKLLIEHDFRRRSGQALLGIRIQAVVMTLLYIAALTYVLITYGFEKNKEAILLSGFLYFLGTVWLQSIGRKIKWKV